MAGFRNVRAYVDAMNNGQTTFATFRKLPSQASTAGQWVDLSMAGGLPVPNYYASEPLVAAELDSYRGIFHGADQDSKFIAEMSMVPSAAVNVCQYILCDYVLYYPFIDMDNLDAQTLDNTVTLPRYTDGEGVMAFAVAVAPTTGSGSFTFEYVNQDGQTVTSPTQFCGTSVANIASFVTSQPATVAGQGPFLTLNQGDTGIRQINSVQMLVANGGLMAIVLVKPIMDFAAREANRTTEVTLAQFKPGPPKFESGAYLNLICRPAGTVASTSVVGHLKTVWN